MRVSTLFMEYLRQSPSRASRMRAIAATLVVMVLLTGTAVSQSSTISQLAEIASLRNKIADPDTRTRVDAFHRVWAIAMSTDSLEVKSSAIEAVRAPVASASDHIRIPAVYALAEIANSTTDSQVKTKALVALHEPLQAGQVPIRDIAVDAVNSIARPGSSSEVVIAALQALSEPVRSGNNGVRMPAMNAIVRAVEHSNDDAACSRALELLAAPLDSEAPIGGMEVRMLAVAAIERIGMNASEAGTKAKAMGMLQSHADKSSWEPEAKKRAAEAALRIQSSMRKG